MWQETPSSSHLRRVCVRVCVRARVCARACVCACDGSGARIARRSSGRQTDRYTHTSDAHFLHSVELRSVPSPPPLSAVPRAPSSLARRHGEVHRGCNGAEGQGCRRHGTAHETDGDGHDTHQSHGRREFAVGRVSEWGLGGRGPAEPRFRGTGTRRKHTGRLGTDRPGHACLRARGP